MLKSLQEILRGDVEHALLHLWSERLSEANAAAIRNRVRNDPKYREAFDGSLEVLASMEELADDDEIGEIVLEYRRLIQERRAKRSAALGVAAGVIVAIGAAVLYFTLWSEPDDSHLEKYFTRVGEQQTIELNDGSVVTLNTGGQLVVDYNELERRILLERGEAYFEVERDPARPFTVELGVRSVTAIGTAFNIRKHPQQYQVAVIEGSVALHELADTAPASPPPITADGEAVVIPARSRHLLEEGWVAEFDVSRNEIRAFRPETMERYEGWRSGMLSFYREPLFQVVQELNRYSRRKILIEDSAVMDLTVYTALSVYEIDSALDGLEKLLPIEVRRHYDRIVITGSEDR